MRFKYSKMYIKAWYKGSETEKFKPRESVYPGTFFCIVHLDKAGVKEVKKKIQKNGKSASLKGAFRLTALCSVLHTSYDVQ